MQGLEKHILDRLREASPMFQLTLAGFLEEVSLQTYIDSGNQTFG